MAAKHPPVPPPTREGTDTASTPLAVIRRQWPIILVATVALLVGLGLIARSGVFSPEPPRPLVGGAFTLVDQTGKTVDETALNGQWNAVFFGFTYCPDICPTTLQALAEAKDQLGPRGKNLRVVFISVDPERDTPERMKAYVEAAGLPDALALTGSKTQIDAVVSAYRASYQKVGDGPDYTVNHTTPVYLMDPKGRFVRPMAYGMTPEEMATQIRDAMRG